MALIEWEDKFSVNVKEIDAQHKKLVEIINELHDAMLKGKSKTVLGEVLDEMINYTKYHFDTEEKYFEKFNYPENSKHSQEHKDFVNKALDFQTKFKDGSTFLSIEIMEFLKDWLSNHIAGSDKKYSDFFNSKGLY